MKKLFAFIFPLLFLFSCNNTPIENTPSKPVVLINIPPYSYFVQKIAGDTVTIQSLIPAGANPHLFEPTLKDVEPLRAAKMWLRNGEAFEDKLLPVLNTHNPHLVAIDLSEGIDLLELNPDQQCAHCSLAESKDRHIWLSPKEAKVQAAIITAAMTKILPENEELYTKNLSALLLELDLLDISIKNLLEPFKNQAILVSHPAFGYFCRDYGLEQLSVEHEGKEPLPHHISHLLNQIEHTKISAVFAEPQYSNKGAEWIAQKLHIPIYLVDPYSADYPATLLSIAKNIAEAH